MKRWAYPTLDTAACTPHDCVGSLLVRAWMVYMRPWAALAQFMCLTAYKTPSRK
jgi:hypothetical protein